MVKDESEFSKNCTTKDGLHNWCKDCVKEYNKTYYKNHREKIIKQNQKYRYKHDIHRMAKNKDCSSYLGCYINERILRHVMPNAILMGNCNPGFDLVCGKGHLVDAKSSTLRHQKNGYPHWHFCIKQNKIPNYFLLTAYKDRESLEIMHMWLIPGNVINDKMSVSISISTIHKWDAYKIDHTDALSCVNQLKASA